jgi:hypothetical protein
MAELRVVGGTFRLGDGAGGIFDWMVREVERFIKKLEPLHLEMWPKALHFQ